MLSVRGLLSLTPVWLAVFCLLIISWSVRFFALWDINNNVGLSNRKAVYTFWIVVCHYGWRTWRPPFNLFYRCLITTQTFLLDFIANVSSCGFICGTCSEYKLTVQSGLVDFNTLNLKFFLCLHKFFFASKMEFCGKAGSE